MAFAGRLVTACPDVNP